MEYCDTSAGASMFDSEKQKIENAVERLTLFFSGNIARSLYLLVACAILPALVIILYDAFVLRDKDISEANVRLENITNSIAQIQAEQTSKANIVAQTLSALPEVKRLDASRCKPIFTSLLRDNPGVANIVLLNPLGDVLASALPSPNGLNVSDRIAFKSAVRSMDFSSGEYCVSLIAKIPVMHFSFPVIGEDGGLTGVLFVAQNLTKYQDFYDNLVISPDSRVSLIDCNGIRLMSLARQTAPSQIGTLIDPLNWRIILESAHDSGQFIGNRFDGVKVLFHFKKLRLKPTEQPYMVVLMNTPSDVVLKDSNRSLELNFSLLALVALMALLCARSLGRVLVGRQVDALREREEHLRIIADNTYDFEYWRAPDGKYIWVSPASESTCGYPPETFVVKSAIRFLHIVHPDDKHIWEDHLDEIDNLHPEHRELEFRIIKPSGETVWISHTCKPIFGEDGSTLGRRGCNRDITERKMTETQLLKLKSGVENSSATIVITDKNGNIEYVNPIFTVTTGYTIDESVGQNPRILKSGFHDNDFYSDMWKTILSGKTWKGEMCNRKKNGQLYWEQVSISPIMDQAGDIQNFVAVKDDISSKKELERIRQDVDRIMRHDLKTPLSAIVGVPQILEMDGNLTEEQLELVKSIEDAGRKMLYMIDSSLDLFKMENGNYDYTPSAVNVVDVVNTITKHVREKVSYKKLDLRVTINGCKPEPFQTFTLAAEDRLLYSLLSNLMLNAIEASPVNEVISVELVGNGFSSIIIRNKGVVPKEIRDYFFDKYKTFGKTSGTGLGTYSAMILAKTMGFTILMCTSDEDNDTCVTVTTKEILNTCTVQ